MLFVELFTISNCLVFSFSFPPIFTCTYTVEPGISKLFGKWQKVYYRQVVYYLVVDLCWKWDFGKHKMFTNASLFTVCKFTNTKFDCISWKCPIWPVTFSYKGIKITAQLLPALHQKVLQDIKKPLWVCSLGYINVLNFTWHTEIMAWGWRGREWGIQIFFHRGMRREFSNTSEPSSSQ